MKLCVVKNYLTSDSATPFFLFIGDDQYNLVLDELTMEGVSFIRTSDFCGAEDKVPDIDALLNKIGAIDKKENIVVKGLGEYLALCGSDEASRILSEFKNKTLNGKKVILLLRGLAVKYPELQKDPRYTNRLCTIIDNAYTDLSLIVTVPSISHNSIKGLKELLISFENGICGNVICSTHFDLSNALFTITKIDNSFDGIKLIIRDFAIPFECGSDYFWTTLLSEIIQNNNSLDNVFKKNKLEGHLENNFYTNITGKEYRNWLYFIALKIKSKNLSNSYLRYVVEKTCCFEDFSVNILNEIINIHHTDSRFLSFYNERKSLASQFSKLDIADFIRNNRKVTSESIYKLTDSTLIECEEIIEWVSKNGLISQLDEIYPALSKYIKKYVFKCPVLADILTDYFVDYKKQKLLNNIEPEFLIKVDELAKSPRKFNQLPTRNEILDKLEKSDTFLYWIDALGVEYLSFIESLAQERGLSISVFIARAELPTITSFNRDFFDTWQRDKEKNDELDEVKHKDKGGYNFEKTKHPIHLAKELHIITAVLDKAVNELAKCNYKRFLIVSDHGASRLAVIRQKEEKYDTDTKGEHSGRCCKLFQPYDLPFAAEENGFLVLADYGRFKGSRAANVEVHGGASLEEVAVPIIELSIKHTKLSVKLVDDVVVFDFRSGVEIRLFFTSPVINVSIILNGKLYTASQDDTYHYNVKIPDVKRAGDYSAEVYTGDELIDKITFKVQGKSGKINTAFDDLF